jgi:hypothetical protein
MCTLYNNEHYKLECLAAHETRFQQLVATYLSNF